MTVKRKLSILVSILVLAVSFSACGKKEEVATQDNAYYEQVSDIMLTQLLPSITEEQIEQLENIEEFAFNSQLYQSQLPLTPTSYVESAKGWLAAKEECGEFLGHGDYTFENSTDKMVVSTQGEFENRDAKISFTFNGNGTLESTTVSPSYTIGEILEKAGLNTILGLGTVFAVLIFIAFIISLMKYIPKLQAAFSGKKEKQIETTTEAVAAPVAPVVSASTGTDEKELIAVISAAIAADTGMNTSDFVVRSIRRRPSNRW